MTNSNSHQTLRALLWALSGIAGIVGLVLIFASGWVLSFVFGSVPPPNTPFEHALLGGIGVLMLPLAFVAKAAAGDPVRYALVVDAFILMLVFAAAFNIYFAFGHQLDAYYPNIYLIVRGAVQLILAAVLFKLRPAASPGGP